MSENEKVAKQENSEKNSKKEFSNNSKNQKGTKTNYNKGNGNSSKKDSKPHASADNKQKKEKKPEYQSQVDKLLKVKQEEYNEQFLKFLEFIKQDSLDNFKLVIDYMGDLYTKEDEKERIKNQKKINKVLLSSTFISFMANLKNRTTDVFYILKKFDDRFGLKDYADLTLNMETIFYGSIVKEEDGSYSIKPPFNSRSIYRLIEIILANDKDLASKWILEVFNFDKAKLRNKKFEDIVNPDADDFKKILMNNPVAHQIFIDMIFSKRPFQTVVELKNQFKETENNLKRNITELEDAKKHLSYDVSSKDGRIRTLENELSVKNVKIEDLTREKNTAINECTEVKLNFDRLQSHHSSQMAIAERIQTNYEQLKIDSENKEKEDEEFINGLENQIEKLNKELETLKADFALKSHKLSEMTSEKESSGTEARSTTMKTLINKVSSPFYYLSMFCQEIIETNKLSEENAPFFVETIKQFEAAFANMGAKKFGKLDEIVQFDSLLHEPMGGKLSNGDAAKITESGWKIDDEIYMKAKVEKMEDK